MVNIFKVGSFFATAILRFFTFFQFSGVSLEDIKKNQQRYLIQREILHRKHIFEAGIAKNQILVITVFFFLN